MNMEDDFDLSESMETDGEVPIDRIKEYQREGVDFMWKCMTKPIVDDDYGCILADEMGLGKTVQCIALVRKLMTDSLEEPGIPTVFKAVIVTPKSLVDHWAKELQRWLDKWLEANGVQISVVGEKNEKEAVWYFANGLPG